MLKQSLVDQLTNLNVLRQGGREKPHKPALLLAILTLADQGRLTTNRVIYSPELVELFAEYLRVVGSNTDAVNMLDPFWRLRSDGLLMPIPRPGCEVATSTSTPPPVRQLAELTDGSRLDEDLFHGIQDLGDREQIRAALVSRYFAGRHQEVLDLVKREQSIGEYERHLEAGERPNVAETPIREQAFRRVVLRAYDYRCSACGLRVILNDMILAEAAHLVPWNESQDDDPRNGVSLCKNHHWAMDRLLLAPTRKHRWQVSSALDDRIEGQRELIDLDGRSMLLPKEARFHPKAMALAWREARLIR